MADEKPSEYRKRVLVPYIVDRLSRGAAEERGYAARVAKAMHISAAHVSSVKDGKRGISEDFVVAIAKFWGIDMDELRSLADRWQAHHDRTEDTSPAARLNRLIDEELRARSARGETFTAQQLSRAHSLAAKDGKFTRTDVRLALDRRDDENLTPTLDADLEAEHHRARGKRRRGG